MFYRKLQLLVALAVFANAENPIVEIPQGLLRGSVDTDRNGNDFYKFMNVPYAQPPIGDLRFKVSID